jgi:hypothetical protein
MSVRQRHGVTSAHMNTEHAYNNQAKFEPALATGTTTGSALTWDDLSETEKSAASLGVGPDDWKPIAFMNTSHYETLLKKNVLAGPLAQKIEAFKEISKT